MTDFRKQWNEACKAAGLVSIGKDTAARILAVVYSFDREDITHSPKLMADVKYIQEEYSIFGGLIPNQDLKAKFRMYVKEIERNNNEPTEWAKKLMEENYGITL